MLKKKYLGKYRTYQLLLALLLTCYLASAQNSKNPFDIVPRVKDVPTREIVMPATNVETEEVVAIELEEEPTPEIEKIEIDSTNPFELITPTSRVSSEPLAEVRSPDTPSTSEIANPIPSSRFKPSKSKGSRGALFGSILGLSLLLAFLFAAFRSSFSKAYQNVTNVNILKQSYREMSTIGQMPLNLWYIFSWLSLGVFVFLVMRYYGAAFSEGFFANLFICIAIVTMSMLLKHFVLFFIGSVFPVRKEIQLYNFLIVIFGVALGVLLVPFNISIAYLPHNFTLYAIYGALGLLAVFYIFRAFRALLLSNRFLSFHRFHFLLYLCAVEIAPIIILLKLGLIYAGK